MILDIRNYLKNLKPMQRWSPQPPDYYTYAQQGPKGKTTFTGAGQPHTGDAELGLWNIKWLVMPDHSDVALRTNLDSNLQDRSCLAPAVAKLRLHGKSLAEWAVEMEMNSFIDMCLDHWAAFEYLFATCPSCRTQATPTAAHLLERFRRRRTN